VSHLVVILYPNYFAPLSGDEQTPITKESTWASLRCHKRDARAHVAARHTEEAQVEQDELLTRNMFEHQADSILLHQHRADDSPISSMAYYDEHDNVDDVDNSIDTDGEHAGPSSHHLTMRATVISGMENPHPEDLLIILPSSLGWEWCASHSAQSLAAKELQLHKAQANDSIHHIRLSLGFKSTLFQTQVRPSKSQKTKTRAWTAIHGVNTTVHEHACIYSMAQDAYLRGMSRWTGPPTAPPKGSSHSNLGPWRRTGWTVQ
jgi:hypothetical protein